MKCKIDDEYSESHTTSVFTDFIKEYVKYPDSTLSTSVSTDSSLIKMNERILNLQGENNFLQSRIEILQSRIESLQRNYFESVYLTDIFFLLREQVYFEKFFSFITEKLMSVQQKNIIQKVFLKDTAKWYSFLQKEYEMNISQLRQFFVVLDLNSEKVLEFLKNDDI